jgi:hypothetical protein
VQNKPNFGPAGWLGPVDYAKQTQFTGGCHAKQSQSPAVAGCTNKPNFRRPGYPLFQYSIIPPFQPDANRAKQSQTWEGWGMWAKTDHHKWGGRRKVERAKQSQFSPGAAMQYKANSRQVLVVQTNPISPRLDTHHPTMPSFRHSRPRPIVRNKTNLAGRPESGGAKCAKQTQFRAGPFRAVPVCQTNPIPGRCPRGAG